MGVNQNNQDKCTERINSGATVSRKHAAHSPPASAASLSPLRARSTNAKHQVVALAKQAIFNGAALGAALDAEGDTLLHLAVHHDLLDCAKRLLAAGADPLARNREGLSAVDLALDGGQQLMLQLLSRRERFRRFLGAEDELCAEEGASPAQRDSCERSSLLSLPSVCAAEAQRAGVVMSLSLGAVHEDYCDWNSSARLFHIKNLLDELKTRERKLFQELQSLSHGKNAAANALRALSERLREREHSVCLSLWDAVRLFRENKALLDRIAHDAARLKRLLSRTERSAYWLGDALLRGEGMFFGKWRPAQLLITGSELCAQALRREGDSASLTQFASRQSEQSFNRNNNNHCNDFNDSARNNTNISADVNNNNNSNNNHNIGSRKKEEPFFSLSTGPFRRQLRRGRRLLRQQKQVCIDLRRLRRLVIVKNSSSQRLDKELLFYYDSSDRDLGTSESAHSDANTHRHAHTSTRSLTHRSCSSDTALSSATSHMQKKSLSVLRLRIQDALQRSTAAEPLVCSADSVAHVVKTLCPGVEVVCQLDGRCYEYQHGPHNAQSPSQSPSHSRRDCEEQRRRVRRESIDDALLGLRSAEREREMEIARERESISRSPARSLSTSFSLSSQRTLSQRLSMSLSHSLSLSMSGATSSESVATIASLVQRQRERDNDNEQSFSSQAFSVSKSHRRSLSAVPQGESAIEKERESDNESEDEREEYVSPSLREEMIQDVNCVPRSRELLLEMREYTQRVNKKLCEAVTMRERLLESLHYLRSLRDFAENPPLSHAVRAEHVSAPSIDALLALLSVYRDYVDKSLPQDSLSHSVHSNSGGGSRSPFFHRMDASGSALRTTVLTDEHAALTAGVRSASLANALEFVRLITDEDVTPTVYTVSRASERASSLSTSLHQKSSPQSFCSRSPSSFAASSSTHLPRDESLCASYTHRSRGDLFEFLHEMIREGDEEEVTYRSSPPRRSPLAAPPAQYAAVYEEVLKQVEKFWDCEFEAFNVAERLTNCLVQRERSSKQLATLREKEITLSNPRAAQEDEELFDVDI